MGQRGPKPKHPALKLLAAGKRPASSTPRRGRVRKGIPPCPVELTGEAAAEWNRVAPELDAAGLLAVVDTGILAAYCLAFADMLAARDSINREGRMISVPQQTSKGKVIHLPRENPACKMLERASNRVEKYAAVLGLTPAARSRMEGDGPAAVDVADGNKVVAIRERFQAAT